jgi:hypothetical protein
VTSVGLGRRFARRFALRCAGGGRILHRVQQLLTADKQIHQGAGDKQPVRFSSALDNAPSRIQTGASAPETRAPPSPAPSISFGSSPIPPHPRSHLYSCTAAACNPARAEHIPGSLRSALDTPRRPLPAFLLRAADRATPPQRARQFRAFADSFPIRLVRSFPPNASASFLNLRKLLHFCSSRGSIDLQRHVLELTLPFDLEDRARSWGQLVHLRSQALNGCHRGSI